MQNILKPRQDRQRENEILYFERLITELVTKHSFPRGFCRPQKIHSANSNADELRMENAQLLLKIQPEQGRESLLSFLPLEMLLKSCNPYGKWSSETFA